MSTTASLSGMTLPSWASHLERKLAPPPLLLVQAFVDTLDLDLHTDVLAHAEELLELAARERKAQ